MEQQVITTGMDKEVPTEKDIQDRDQVMVNTIKQHYTILIINRTRYH